MKLMDLQKRKRIKRRLARAGPFARRAPEGADREEKKTYAKANFLKAGLWGGLTFVVLKTLYPDIPGVEGMVELYQHLRDAPWLALPTLTMSAICLYKGARDLFSSSSLETQVKEYTHQEVIDYILQHPQTYWSDKRGMRE